VFIAAVKTYFLLKGSHYAGDVIDQARAHRPEPVANVQAQSIEQGTLSSS
jgi:hypothetical protein